VPLYSSGDGLYTVIHMVFRKNHRLDFSDYVVQMDIPQVADRSTAEPGMEIFIAHQHV
jgi:hypothetical protein